MTVTVSSTLPALRSATVRATNPPGVVLNELWGYTDPAAIEAKVESSEGLRSEDVADAVLYMLTRPANVTIRDLVILPQNQDI